MFRVFEIERVPLNEVEEVRAALQRSRVTYYETPRSTWCNDTAAIWVKTEDDLKKARVVIDALQREFRKTARTVRENEVDKKEVPRHIFAMALALTVLYCWAFFSLVFGGLFSGGVDVLVPAGAVNALMLFAPVFGIWYWVYKCRR